MNKEKIPNEEALPQLSWITLLFSPEQVKRSLIMSFIVGTILNLINQGHLISTPEQINIVNLLLTYMVPYIVSSVAAAQSKAHFIKQSQLTLSKNNKSNPNDKPSN